jgi:hypothetical protein
MNASTKILRSTNVSHHHIAFTFGERLDKSKSKSSLFPIIYCFLSFWAFARRHGLHCAGFRGGLRRGFGLGFGDDGDLLPSNLGRRLELHRSWQSITVTYPVGGGGALLSSGSAFL